MFVETGETTQAAPGCSCHPLKQSYGFSDYFPFFEDVPGFGNATCSFDRVSETVKNVIGICIGMLTKVSLCSLFILRKPNCGLTEECTCKPPFHRVWHLHCECFLLSLLLVYRDDPLLLT